MEKDILYYSLTVMFRGTPVPENKKILGASCFIFEFVVFLIKIVLFLKKFSQHFQRHLICKN